MPSELNDKIPETNSSASGFNPCNQVYNINIILYTAKHYERKFFRLSSLYLYAKIYARLIRSVVITNVLACRLIKKSNNSFFSYFNHVKRGILGK
jgi:hypothetical protein